MRKFILALAALLLLLTPIQCYGEESDYASELHDALPSPAQGIFDGEITEESVSDRLSVTYLLSLFRTDFNESLAESSSVLATVFCITVIFCLATSLESVRERKGATLAVSLACSLTLYRVLSPFFELVHGYLADISAVCTAITPISVSLMLSSGGMSSSYATGSAMSAMTLFFDRICTEALLPICTSTLMLSVCASFSEFNLGAVVSFLKRIFMITIGFFSMLITASFGMQSIIASHSDTLLSRTAKFAVSTSLPIVGSTVSSSMSTLTSSLMLMKSTLGLGTVLSVIAVLLPPLLCILLIRIVLSMSRTMCSLVGTREAEGVLGNFLSVFDMLLAMLLLSAITLIVVLSIFIKSSVSV